MADFNFADSYRAAGLNPGPDILRLRQAPFEKLRKKLDAQMAVNLTRLYFGMRVPMGTDWFRDAFGAEDASFSLIDNEREAALLASGLLSAAIADHKMYAALALLTTAVDQAREPAVRPEVMDEARQAITSKAIQDRQRERSNPEQIKLPPQSKVPTEAEALAQAGDWAKTANLFKQISAESYEATKNLANQTAWVTRPLAKDVLDLREEVEMLWWHIGGWSRVLERPFSDLNPAVAAVMAGLDLADLSSTPAGPVAAPAILQRTITTGRKKLTNVTISEAVDGFPPAEIRALALGDALASVPDVCPVLTAFAKASEIGTGTAWHDPYTRMTGIAPSTEFSPLGLALQVYRERLLLAALSR
ncbi:TPA: hypothetical protein QDB01_002921 [Burkholderia vietnamiensis]|nr:hypothetical protein [Burkholderia vietnamiensis]